jgi:hypothetical protein
VPWRADCGEGAVDVLVLERGRVEGVFAAVEIAWSINALDDIQIGEWLAL